MLSEQEKNEIRQDLQRRKQQQTTQQPAQASSDREARLQRIRELKQQREQSNAAFLANASAIPQPIQRSTLTSAMPSLSTVRSVSSAENLPKPSMFGNPIKAVTGGVGDLWTSVKNRASTLKQDLDAIGTEKGYDVTTPSGRFKTLVSPRGALRLGGFGAGTFGDASFQALKLAAPQGVERMAGDAVGKVAGTDIVQAGVGAWQGYAEQNPERAQDIRDVANIASVLPITAGVRKVFGATTRTARNLGRIDDVAGGIVDARRAANTTRVREIAGRIAQGKKGTRDAVSRGLSEIDTVGIETYEALNKSLTDRIGAVADEVDNYLDNVAPAPLKMDAMNTVKDVGGRVVSNNYVTDALRHLRELYTKTNDFESKAIVDDVIQRMQTTGLTPSEINNIARAYGDEFGSKAFSKVSGDPLTSVNAQLFENTRRGVKETFRNILPDDTARIMDSRLSDMIRTRELTRIIEERVAKLEQAVNKRGVAERIARIVGRGVDTATGHSLRGLLTSFIPGNVGYKTLNALDIQEQLARNLKKLDTALAAQNSDDFITKVASLFAKNGGQPLNVPKSAKPVSNAYTAKSQGNIMPRASAPTINSTTPTVLPKNVIPTVSQGTPPPSTPLSTATRQGVQKSSSLPTSIADDPAMIKRLTRERGAAGAPSDEWLLASAKRELAKTPNDPKLKAFVVDRFIKSNAGERPYISGIPQRWMYKKNGVPTDVPADIAKVLDSVNFKTLPSSRVTKTSNNLYHTTKAENIDSIMKEGLVTGKKARFEGVSSKKKISFSANEEGAKYYGGSGDIMIRTKAGYKPSNLENDLLAGGEGAYTTTGNIPPDMLEVKIGNKWAPLAQYNRAHATTPQKSTMQKIKDAILPGDTPNKEGGFIATGRTPRLPDAKTVAKNMDGEDYMALSDYLDELRSNKQPSMSVTSRAEDLLDKMKVDTTNTSTADLKDWLATVLGKKESGMKRITAKTDKYATYRSKVGPGQLLVKDNKGRIGVISKDKFDGTLYERI